MWIDFFGYLLTGVILFCAIRGSLLGVNFSRRVRRNKTVDSSDVRKTTREIILVALVFGFSIGLLIGWVAYDSPTMPSGLSGLVLLVMQTLLCTSVTPIIVAVVFLISVNTLKSIYSEGLDK